MEFRMCFLYKKNPGELGTGANQGEGGFLILHYHEKH